MTETDQTPLLILQNWFSPAFPIGAFSYSSGLEIAIHRGDVDGRASLASWLTISMLHGTVFTDALFLRAAMADEDVNDLCLALCAGAERHRETTELGAAFISVMRQTQAITLPSGLAYPVAIGMAARQLNLQPQPVVAAFVQAVCMNQISVAVRTVPIGQIDGQSCLLSLAPVIQQVATRAMTTKVDAVGSFVPGADLCAFEHETATQRIYRT